MRAAASDKDPLAVILQNEYTSGRLIRQILPGNRIYTYDYDGGPTDKAIHFTVHAPDGHVYHIDNQGVNPDDNPYTARETIADPGSNPHETKRSVQ